MLTRLIRLQLFAFLAVSALARPAAADLEADIESVLAAVSPPEAATRTWSASVTLYGWLASTAIETGGQRVNIGVDEVASKTSGALMVRANVMWKRWSLLVDYIYADVRDTQPLNLGTLSAKVRQDVLDVRIGYSVIDTRPAHGEPGTLLIMQAGGRYWETRANTELRIPPALPGGTERVFQSQVGSSWWDPIVGARAVWIYTPKVAFLLEANVGGFGLGASSDYTWGLAFYTSLRISKHFAVDVGYRILQYKRESGGSDTKLTMSGPVIGISFIF